jgi:hypothetical protein
MLELACHPKQAYFAQRNPALSLPKGICASRAKGRIFCDTIIARLARFLILLEVDNTALLNTENV